ncbi:Uncharacterized protein dnl_09000 [Desulfonema limicola]|uniref:Uncharacterized protein n=1 Tax=Desulfonema limicola TaxID=45656 RepID=A0A975GEX1_9BACT|nr:Uncharacterized protein dnl_09000 [Desulfonema limicola]
MNVIYNRLILDKKIIHYTAGIWKTSDNIFYYVPEKECKILLAHNPDTDVLFSVALHPPQYFRLCSLPSIQFL